MIKTNIFFVKGFNLRNESLILEVTLGADTCCHRKRRRAAGNWRARRLSTTKATERTTRLAVHLAITTRVLARVLTVLAVHFTRILAVRLARVLAASTYLAALA